MADDVVVITPETEAGSGGLADYSRRIAEEWGARARIRFSNGSDPSEWSGRVLLQYSAYGFDRLGYPRSLLRALIDWRKRTSEARLVVMLHEIWTFWPFWNKNRLIQHLHRRDLRKLISVADAVFTSTPSQAEHLRELSEIGSIQVMPVGANIRPLAGGVAREEGLAVIFGLPASRARVHQIMQSELDALLAQQRLTKIVEAGGEAVPEKEISELLSRASFGISAQDERSLMKSGSFMAYAAHGLNILSPYGDPLGAEPLCWLTRPRDLLNGIAAEELEHRAQRLRDWQERTSSWPQIAERFAEALQLEKARPV